MATTKERQIAQLIKKVDMVHQTDRDARAKLESQIEGPFSSGFFTFNDETSAVLAAIEAYQSAFNALDMLDLDDNSELGQHYQTMIELLS